jgi:hypothetical protein
MVARLALALAVAVAANLVLAVTQLVQQAQALRPRRR